MPALVITTDEVTLPDTVHDLVASNTTYIAIVYDADIGQSGISIDETSFDDLIAAVTARTDDRYDAVLRELDRQFFLIPERSGTMIQRQVNGGWMNYTNQFIKFYNETRGNAIEHVVWTQDKIDIHPMLLCACSNTAATRKLIRVTYSGIVYYVGLHEISYAYPSPQRYTKYLAFIERPYLHFSASTVNIGYDGESVNFPYKTVAPANPTWPTLLQFVARPDSPIHPRYLLNLPRLADDAIVSIDILAADQSVVSTHTFAWGDYAATFA